MKELPERKLSSRLKRKIKLKRPKQEPEFKNFGDWENQLRNRPKWSRWTPIPEMRLFLLNSKNGHKTEVKGKSRFGGIFSVLKILPDFSALSAAKFFKALRRLF